MRLVGVAIVAFAPAWGCGCRSGPAPVPTPPVKAEAAPNTGAAKDATGGEAESTTQPSTETESASSGEAETDQIVKLHVGETFDLSLPESPTTAHTWKCMWEPEGLLQLTKTEYIPDQPTQVDSGGTRHYHFAAAQAGKATITLVPSAGGSGKEEDVAEQKTVEVEISP